MISLSSFNDEQLDILEHILMVINDNKSNLDIIEREIKTLKNSRTKRFDVNDYVPATMEEVMSDDYWP